MVSLASTENRGLGLGYGPLLIYKTCAFQFIRSQNVPSRWGDPPLSPARGTTENRNILLRSRFVGLRLSYRAAL